MPQALGALLGVGGGGRPRDLGVQDYGGGRKSLGLCPPAPSCISTADPADRAHYVPPWNFNPALGRGGPLGPQVSRRQAMAELEEAVAACRADGFSAKVVARRGDYLGAEFRGRWPLGGVDDVEFWFPPGEGSRVEFRSASRAGGDDGGVNRRRVRALRQALEAKGWRSERL